jgi:N-hydroxyarylamine O-acetyltransferase
MYITAYGENYPKLSDSIQDHYLQLLKVERKHPSHEFLTELMHSHVRTIPWENNDLILHNKIILDVEKIILQYDQKSKGGLCYQVNATFFALLRSLGFQGTFHPAMVYAHNHKVYKEPRFTHVVPKVRLNGIDYLADVIWGGLSEPLSLHSPRLDYFIENQDGEWVVIKSSDGHKTIQYKVFDREMTEDDLLKFIDYDNASEEREVAHRLMFFLFED